MAIPTGALLPSTASVNDEFLLTVNNVIYRCFTTNTWTPWAAVSCWGSIQGTLANQADVSAAIASASGVPTSRTVNGHALTADVTVTKTDVTLGNCDNTSDANKPVSTATQTALNLKEATITAGTTGQYWRGDKSFQTLDKTAVGLANVDNTSDANKPVSTAAQTALNAKLTAASNLSDIANAATARTSLGLGPLAIVATVALPAANFPALTGDVTTSAGSLATAIKTSVSLTTPVLGVATATSVAATGAITSSGGGIGYATGNGGTVTQATSKATGVTLNKLCGTITLNAAALAAAATVTFIVTNSFVAATDVIVVQHDTVGAIGSYLVMPNTSAAGSFRISVRNNSAASLAEAIVLRFAIIKAVVA